MRATHTAKATIFVALTCSWLVVTAVVGNAATKTPSPVELAPTGRRIAARALQRARSTDWPTDVSARLRLLEEHADRAAHERSAIAPEGTTR